MHRCSATARRQPGLVHTGVVEDDGGQLVGLAVEESEAPAEATRPALLAEIGDAFDTWHA